MVDIRKLQLKRANANLGIRLPGAVKNALFAWCQTRDVKPSAVVSQLIQDFLRKEKVDIDQYHNDSDELDPASGE